jgi:5-methylcytosine-specific restriction endonuclease McrA
MAQPTEHEILVKAKQLAQDEGKLWLWGSEERDNERDERGPFIYDSLRTDYLNRALALLRQEKN